MATVKSLTFPAKKDLKQKAWLVRADAAIAKERCAYCDHYLVDHVRNTTDAGTDIWCLACTMERPTFNEKGAPLQKYCIGFRHYTTTA